MSKMEKRTKKFEAIVSSARSLFWKYGVKRVTIEEICTAAGVSRMTFYKYFDDKTGVAKYIIENMHGAGLKVYKDILNKDITYDAKVRLWIEMKSSNAHEMSQELINDIYKSKDEELFNTVEKIKNEMLSIYIEDFKEAQKKGELRSDVKPELVLYIFNHLVDIFTNPEVVAMYSNPEQLISEAFGFMFYGLIPRNSEKS